MYLQVLVKNGCRLMITQGYGQRNHPKYLKQFGYGDKVHDLHVMKLMVKKEYIFSCYEAAVNMNQHVQGCHCHGQSKVAMIEECIQSSFNCHSNSPDIYCTVINHVECFDPIFR